MGNIVLLDDLTINKIAAGEVIERPASVVKEMVENSIDAGAKNITVEIRNGGISFIKISDDGKGISEDDLEIAFERHATSKIRSAEDLNTVKSMGFRGEALASIAAIANVEVVSKPENQETGYKVVVEAGNILEKSEVGCKNGTTMIVKNLFFNTPVRYKFLKKDFTESGYIEDVITRIALVNPEISIKLINTGKTVIQTTGNGKLKDVVYSIYGKDVAENVIETNYEYEGIKVIGAVGKPEIARSNRSNQIFFVNKRYVKDKTLSAAMEQAFKGIVPMGKFGFSILNMEIDPSKVDVNVHPAKLEVRFEEENKVFQAIYHAVKEAVFKNESSEKPNDILKDEEKLNKEITSAENIVVNKPFQIINDTEKVEKVENNVEEDSTNIIEELYNKRFGNNEENNEENNEDIKIEQDKNEEQNEDKNENKNEEVLEIDALKELEKIKEKMTQNVNKLNEPTKEYKIEEAVIEKIENDDSKNTELENEKTENKDIEEKKIVEEKVEEKYVENKNENVEQEEKILNNDFNAMFERTFGKLPVQPKEESKEIKDNAVDLLKDNVSIFTANNLYQKPIYKYIGLAFDTYIILEIEKEMYIVDWKNVNERILYEKIKNNYYNENFKDSQMLLLPDVITLTQKQMDITKENLEMFEKAGFSLEEFGENTIKLTGVPTVCLEVNTKDLFLEILNEINTVARIDKKEKEEKFMWTVASKASINTKNVFDEKEVRNTIDKLLQLPDPFICQNNKNVAIKMNKYDIERKFSRK